MLTYQLPYAEDYRQSIARFRSDKTLSRQQFPDYKLLINGRQEGRLTTLKLKATLGGERLSRVLLNWAPHITQIGDDFPGCCMAA